MKLPEGALFCINALERAGYPAYAVGGCVRDTLLGLTPHDYDLCTAAEPAQICRVFHGFPLVHSGEKHGTVGIVMGKGEVYEITTFRAEGGYRDSRHPDWVRFVPTVEADLSRRDFTVNAMAYSPLRGFADPFGGQQDLRLRRLRTVGDPALRFSEDALRILRGVRFSARYHLMPEPKTRAAMDSLAPLMDRLARERVFDELCKLLLCASAADYKRFSSILTQVIPELAPTIGFRQHNSHHAYDVFTHTAHVTENVPPLLPLRWAALLHDIGKPAAFTLDEAGQGHFYGHGKIGAEMAEEILRRLKAPTVLRERVVFLVERHMTLPPPEKKAVRRWLSRFGQEKIQDLLTLQEADMCGKGTGIPGQDAPFSQIRGILSEILAEGACLTVRDLAVDGHDLMALGLTGPAVGRTLRSLLEQVLDEQIPNTRAALLAAIPRAPGGD